MKRWFDHWRPVMALVLLLGFGLATNLRLAYVVAKDRFILDNAVAEHARLQQAQQVIGTNAELGLVTDWSGTDSTLSRRFMLAQHTFAPGIVRRLPFPPQPGDQPPARVLVYPQSAATLQMLQSAYRMQIVQRIDADLVILGR